MCKALCLAKAEPNEKKKSVSIPPSAPNFVKKCIIAEAEDYSHYVSCVAASCPELLYRRNVAQK